MIAMTGVATLSNAGNARSENGERRMRMPVARTKSTVGLARLTNTPPTWRRALIAKRIVQSGEKWIVLSVPLNDASRRVKNVRRFRPFLARCGVGGTS